MVDAIDESEKGIVNVYLRDEFVKGKYFGGGKRVVIERDVDSSSTTVTNTVYVDVNLTGANALQISYG